MKKGGLRYGEFGEFEHQLFLADVVEIDDGFAAVAGAFDGDDFAGAELGVDDGDAGLDGVDVGGGIS